MGSSMAALSVGAGMAMSVELISWSPDTVSMAAGCSLVTRVGWAVT